MVSCTAGSQSRQKCYKTVKPSIPPNTPQTRKPLKYPKPTSTTKEAESLIQRKPVKPKRNTTEKEKKKKKKNRNIKRKRKRERKEGQRKK